MLVYGYDIGVIVVILYVLMQQFGYVCYQVVGYDVGMWVVYVLVSDQFDVVQWLVIIEVVIFGLVEVLLVFVVLEDNIFLWYFMFNQVCDLFEVLIVGCECVYLIFMFDCWVYCCEVVVCEVYICVYLVLGGFSGGFGYYCVIFEMICQNC